MASFRFLTEWCLEAPIQQVWDVLTDYQAMPTWWPAIQEITELQPGNPDGVGGLWRQAWKTPLGYAIRFEAQITEVTPPHQIALTATGMVDGSGRWELCPGPEGTQVRYYWTVTTTRAWMNALALVMKPLMEWNHDRVMEQGGVGLARHLGVKLVRNQTLMPRPEGL